MTGYTDIDFYITGYRGRKWIQQNFLRVRK